MAKAQNQLDKAREFYDNEDYKHAKICALVAFYLAQREQAEIASESDDMIRKIKAREEEK